MGKEVDAWINKIRVIVIQDIEDTENNQWKDAQFMFMTDVTVFLCVSVPNSYVSSVFVYVGKNIERVCAPFFCYVTLGISVLYRF